MQRNLHGCESLKEGSEKMALAKLLMSCTPECANFTRLRDPKAIAETVRHMQEFDRMHGLDSRWKWSNYGDSRSDDRSSFKDGVGNEKGQGPMEQTWVSTCFKCGIKGLKGGVP